MSSSFTTVACKTPAKKIHMVQDKSQTEFVVAMDTCFHWTLHLVSMATAMYLKKLPGVFGIKDVMFTPYCWLLLVCSVHKITEVLPYFNCVLKEVNDDQISDPCGQTHTYSKWQIPFVRDHLHREFQLDCLESVEKKTEAHLGSWLDRK